jgi:arsenite methyltransferase
MTDARDLRRSTTSSQGHHLSEGTYLDSHFVAARAEYKAMAHFAGFQPGWSVLDAGAGGGSFLPILSEMVAAEGSIEAVDIDPENVHMIQARAQSGEFACPVTAQVAALTSLPYDDNQFDAIWCANVLQYLTDAEVAKAVEEFKRVVRPGGLIVVKDSDTSAMLVGAAPVLFWHAMEQACAHPDSNISAYFKNLLRMPQLPHLYSKLGIEVLRYKTFLIEWQHPVRAIDRPLAHV